MTLLKSLTDFEDSFYFNKKVFIRVDFNVKVIDGFVSEDYRIRSSMSTIEYLVKRGAKVILGFSFRPTKGKRQKVFIVTRIQKIVRYFVTF